MDYPDQDGAGTRRTVTLDPALHARTVAAVERAQQQEREQLAQGA